ncbi:hypothetical protein B7H18_27415 [Pseudomonas putida]|nr:hypothetical protein B7H18_27415 [Pseudomonas putida]
MRQLQRNAVPVGAALAANTGKAGAIHRVAFFAGEPAPTRAAQCLRSAPYLWEPGLPAMGCTAAPAI